MHVAFPLYFNLPTARDFNSLLETRYVFSNQVNPYSCAPRTVNQTPASESDGDAQMFVFILCVWETDLFAGGMCVFRRVDTELATDPGFSTNA